MTPAARVAAAIDVLDVILDGKTAEQALSAWARNSRFAGSKDRAALRDLVFDALRQRASCAAHGGGLHGRGLMVGLGALDDWDMDTIFSGEGHAPSELTEFERDVLLTPPDLSDADRHDIPEVLWAMWCADLGDAATASAQVLRSRAPLYLRVNQKRTDVAGAISALAEDKIETKLHPVHPGCLQVMSNPRRVKMSSAFETGLIEIQDAASQLTVSELGIGRNVRVLDYCAGGGGKSLAIADAFHCDIFAHDIAEARTRDIAPRAARAGADIKVLLTDDIDAAAPFDVIVVDAPCSGSGTWRRNPEAKWAASPEKINEFSDLQMKVLTESARFLKAGGQLVYMTCSVFRAENEAVITRFMAHNPGYTKGLAKRLIPDANSDGFYLQVLHANETVKN